MARPRKASDEEIFAATHRAMSRLGPQQLTLTEIAGEAGLTAGAIVQRFGSKRGLLLALMARFADAMQEWFAALRAAHDSPLDALYDYAVCVAGMGESPASLAHSLSYLQLDLTDPDFHAHARAQAAAAREGIRGLLDAAVTAKELARGTDTAALARAVEVAVSGSLMTHAFYRDGRAADRMREDLDQVLRPYRPRPRKR